MALKYIGKKRSILNVSIYWNIDQKTDVHLYGQISNTKVNNHAKMGEIWGVQIWGYVVFYRGRKRFNYFFYF